MVLTILISRNSHDIQQLSEGEDEESTQNCDRTQEYDTTVLGSEGVGYVWKYGKEGESLDFVVYFIH